MLYKNKIKVQNILKSAVALMLMLTLSLSTALSPLAKAEEAKYTWKTLTSAPISDVNSFRGNYISPDGSKLFILGTDSSYNANLWMSADDGATWRKIWLGRSMAEHVSISTDGSKIVLLTPDSGQRHFYISTDGGHNWTERVTSTEFLNTAISPDGSFLTGCSINGRVHTTYISTDDGHTWTQKGTNSIECPTYVTNNGTLIAQSSGDMAKSTDYGQTWTETPGVLNGNSTPSFSNNGNTIFDGDKISLDGGNHWTPLNAPIPANTSYIGSQISDDGKKLSIMTVHNGMFTLLTSTDGGRTWDTEEDSRNSAIFMSSDGSKLFRMVAELVSGGAIVRYRVGTLTTPQPVTPGSGAAGAVAPSTGSTSATSGQKPGKASGRLAETGASTWTVGGLAVVAVAAGALVLRKRL